MTVTRVSRALLLSLIAVGLVLPGCASKGPKKDQAYVAMDVETLYNVARDTMAKGNYKQAALMYDEVERQHPYSVWARRAQLMAAFCYYVARQYPDAIASAQRFLSLHPGSREAAYAYYMIAISYYEQISPVDRDQKITQQALDSLGELIRRYPTTKYADDARLKVDLARDHLAGKEMDIGRFYQKSGLYLAAIIRYRTVVDQYDTTSHTPEALFRLVETYLSLGIPVEANKAAAVLGYNYPGSKWFERAHTLMAKVPAVAAAKTQQPAAKSGA
jgi:outer membrane protein assembly factor BamD